MSRPWRMSKFDRIALATFGGVSFVAFGCLALAAIAEKIDAALYEMEK